MITSEQEQELLKILYRTLRNRNGGNEPALATEDSVEMNLILQDLDGLLGPNWKIQLGTKYTVPGDQAVCFESTEGELLRGVTKRIVRSIRKHGLDPVEVWFLDDQLNINSESFAKSIRDAIARRKRIVELFCK